MQHKTLYNTHLFERDGAAIDFLYRVRIHYVHYPETTKSKCSYRSARQSLCGHSRGVELTRKSIHTMLVHVSQLHEGVGVPKHTAPHARQVKNCKVERVYILYMHSHGFN